VLVDFVAEFTLSLGASIGICQVRVKRWQVHKDGASNGRGLGVGIIMVSPKELRMEKLLRLGFITSNNEAEYEALIAGLQVMQKPSAKVVELFSNSRLVVS